MRIGKFVVPGLIVAGDERTTRDAGVFLEYLCCQVEAQPGLCLDLGQRAQFRCRSQDSVCRRHCLRRHNAHKGRNEKKSAHWHIFYQIGRRYGAKAQGLRI